MLLSTSIRASLLLLSTISIFRSSVIASSITTSMTVPTSWIWMPIGFISTSTVGYITTLTDEATNKTCVTTIFNEEFLHNSSQTLYSRTNVNEQGTQTTNIDGTVIAYPTDFLQGTTRSGGRTSCNGPSSCCKTATSTTHPPSLTTTRTWAPDPSDPRGLMKTLQPYPLNFVTKCTSWTTKEKCTYSTCETEVSITAGISTVNSVPYVLATSTPVLCC